MSTRDELIGVRVDGAVLVVTLQRPEKRNALSLEMRNGLRDAFDQLDADPHLRCGVLAAQGPVFCAGADLAEMADARMAVPPAEMTKLLGSTGRTRKPVVAAVHGPAAAGGFKLALDCDLVVAGHGAWFEISEARRGRGAPWATPLFDMVSSRVMAELLLTGRRLSASRAEQVGLVNRVVADGEVLEVALDLAHAIAANAPLSVEASRELIEMCGRVGAGDARWAADLIFQRVYDSADAQEGPRAYAEGRAPVWQGR